MTENEKQLKETERILKRLHQKGDITPEAFTILNDRNKQAINYIHCCKSDSEQLNHEDLEIGEQVIITQTKLVEINYFREDGDIDVEDATRLYTVSLNEISKVV